jgi:hypothetical protein
MSFRVAPDSHLPALPRVNSPGCPGCSFPRLADWWLSGSPRVPHLSAMQVVSCRVAPVPRSSCCACCGASSRLDARTLQRSRRSSPGSPHGFDPPARLLAISRVAPVLRSRIRTGDGVPGFPESRILRFCRLASSGIPESCFNGRSDDESRFLELCIL